MAQHNPHPGHLDHIRGGLARGDNTYLRMRLKERTRLHPPVSMLMPRRSKIETELAEVTTLARSVVLSIPVLLVQDQEFRSKRWEGTQTCLAPRFFTTILETTMSTVLMKHDSALAESDPWMGQPTALQHFPNATSYSSPPWISSVQSIELGDKIVLREIDYAHDCTDHNR